eukprot:COSAG05_NODE_25_length_31349_cov_4.978560_30_plen_336_part_00
MPDGKAREKDSNKNHGFTTIGCLLHLQLRVLEGLIALQEDQQQNQLLQQAPLPQQQAGVFAAAPPLATTTTAAVAAQQAIQRDNGEAETQNSEAKDGAPDREDLLVLAESLGLDDDLLGDILDATDYDYVAAQTILRQQEQSPPPPPSPPRELSPPPSPLPGSLPLSSASPAQPPSSLSSTAAAQEEAEDAVTQRLLRLQRPTIAGGMLLTTAAANNGDASTGTAGFGSGGHRVRLSSHESEDIVLGSPHTPRRTAATFIHPGLSPSTPSKGQDDVARDDAAKADGQVVEENEPLVMAFMWPCTYRLRHINTKTLCAKKRKEKERKKRLSFTLRF